MEWLQDGTTSPQMSWSDATMGELQKAITDPEMLVQRYFANPRPELKDMILVQFGPTVERVARRFAGIEAFEDLVQVGYIGLLNAIKRFDPESGVRFNTYATHLIAGEIKHHLRDKSQVIRHPAWLQELRHKASKAATRLQSELGRPATNNEIARDIGVSESSIEEVQATADLLKVSSFDNVLPGDDESSEIDNMPAYTTESLGVEERLLLESAMGQLRDLEREVLMAFHFESLSQTEIANRLSISCNYVSHILRQSLGKLRRILTNEDVSDRVLKKAQENLEQEVLDPVTGLYNEDYFQARLEEEVHRANSDKSPMSIVLIRFENLESLKGYYGGACVTDFMADAAEFCKESIRRLDVTCCYGSEGFGIILPSTGATAAVVTARLQAKFAPWLLQRRVPSGAVSVLVGYAYIDGQVKTATQLLSEAEGMFGGEEQAQAA